jgi:hypothetical protein
MTFVKRLVVAAALGVAMLIGSGLSVPSAQAGYIVTLEQVGSNVVATGSGTIDLADLHFDAHFGGNPAEIAPNVGTIITGPTTPQPTDQYEGFPLPLNGPEAFGPPTATGTLADSGMGDAVGLGTFDIPLFVPEGYVSGAPLSDTSTYDNTTIAKLGATPGTYVWTWGSGAHADSFTLQVGAVPAPLIGRGLPVLLAAGGILFGAKLLERGKRHELHVG